MRRLSHADCVRLAREAFIREDWSTAAQYYKLALKDDRDNPEFLRKASLALSQSNSLPEAEELARKACKRHPNDPDNWIALALVCQKLERESDQHAALDRALRVDPVYGPAIHAKAKAYFEAGDTDAALRVTTPFQTDPNAPPLSLLIHARVCRSLKRYDDAIAAVTRVIDHPETLPRHRIGALFELGSTLDAKGEYDDAFAAFSRANAGMPPGVPLHAESVINTWTRSLLDSLPESGNDAQRPVLVVGVARSGTTLTEQIISSHPKGGGVGELVTLPAIFRRTVTGNLTQSMIAAYADEYLGVLAERAPDSAERVVDKHMYCEPSLGLFSKMFPRARVVHCLRDPLDCCLSAFFQNFGANLPVSRDLPTLGRHYVAHRRIMEHWKQTLDIPIHTSTYEELVTEQEPRSRELIDFLGLPWDDACLRFHEHAGTVRTASTAQVRQPMYTSSTQRWRRYEKHLGPLIDALGPYADHARTTA